MVSKKTYNIAISLLVKSIPIFIFIVGLYLLINSTSIGMKSVNLLVFKHDSSVDTSTYLTVLRSSIISYQIIGVTFLAIGLFFTLKKINN